MLQIKIKPKNLQTDLGKEFYITDFKNILKTQGVNHYSTFSIVKGVLLNVLKDEKFLLEHAYFYLKIIDPKKPKFELNDFVRVSKHREIFSKGYTLNWSYEIFKIIKVVRTNPTSYVLEDSQGNHIKDGLYSEDFQKAKHPGVFLVEKILRRKGNKLYVKWLVLNNTHNS